MDRQHEGKPAWTAPPETRGPQCPSLEEWGLYEAGLLPENRGLELLEHASGCDSCGVLLTDMHSGTVAGQDATLLLKSGTSSWKKQMVSRIVSPAEEAARPRFGFRGAWRAAAAAAVAAAGLSWWIYTASSAGGAFPELAQAYSQQRPFEMRIPGAAYRSFVRGSEMPAGSLQPITDKIHAALEKDPKSLPWLRSHALADLLQGNYRHALEDLRLAQTVDPENPDIWADLGVAYLARADAEGRSEDIVPAIDFLSRAIVKQPKESVFVFNRALAFERMGEPEKARDDWNKFLELESSGAWADEARRHLALQEQKINDRKDKAKLGPDAEGAILLLAAHGFKGTGTVHPEDVARELKEVHGDPWMQDLLAASNGSAMELVQGASQSNATGHDADAIDLWTSAENQLRNESNASGFLFARLERAYSMLRVSDPNECLRLINTALPEATQRRYHWIEIQLNITRGSCLGQLALSDSGYETYLLAADAAGQAGFRISKLYALGLAAAALRQVGSYRQAMKIDSEGVGSYWAGEGDRTRAYQFYYGLASDASALHYSEAAAVFMGQAVRLAELGPNRAVEAMVRARNAELLTDKRDMHEAEREFQRAGTMFQSLGSSSDMQYYEAYANLSRAAFDAQEGHVAEGFQELDHIASALPSVKNNVVEARYWSLKSDLHTRSGDLAESERCLRHVLDLSSPGKSVDSPALARQVSSAVETLADRERQHDAAAALELRNAYYPSFRTVSDSPSVSKLVFATLPSGPSVWVSHGGSVIFYHLPVTSQRLQSLTSEFFALLADQSEIERVRYAGKQLYDALIAPLEGSLVGASILYVSADGPVAEIPFGALVNGKGQWLASQFRISYSMPLRGVASGPAPGVTTDARLLAVGAERGGKVMHFSLAPLTSVATDLKAAAQAFPDHRVLSGAEASGPALVESLGSANVFHFSGHAIVTGTDAALVLTGGQTRENQVALTWTSKIPRASLKNIRLAVLAACGTGKAGNEDEEPSSMMARTFLEAGVPEVIASRWDADSTATSYLIQDFYRRLQQGAAPEGALAGSINALREKSAFAHPYYWAAFDDFRL